MRLWVNKGLPQSQKLLFLQIRVYLVVQNQDSHHLIRCIELIELKVDTNFLYCDQKVQFIQIFILMIPREPVLTLIISILGFYHLNFFQSQFKLNA
jgi:hypothetical protein